MFKGKYDYDTTMELIKKAVDTTQEVTRTELMIAMTGAVLEDQEEINKFTSALSNLKLRKLRKCNINLHKKDNETYTVRYIIQKADKVDTEKKSRPEKKVNVVNNTVLALEKDNQKLFLEKEEIKEQFEILQQQYEELLAKEKEYKSIIQSFYSLAMGTN